MVFFEEARRQAHGFVVARDLAVAETDLDGLADLGAELAHWRSGSGADVRVFEMHHATCSVQLRGDNARSIVAARTDGEANVAVEAIAACLTHAEPRDDEMPVAFWSANGMGGGGCEVRTVAAPGWEDIRATQASAPRAALDRLMRGECPPGGRLVFWHGEPGTGKTFALRALVRAWRPWCAFHFITDPEDLLTRGSAYLLDVLTAADHDGQRDWRLVILEDAGELLSVDAREKSGQALSRLLNATDGFLGHGTNTIVLITTNEPIGSLHPAVTRPGRCLAEVEFTALTTEEANRWLAGEGSEVRVTQPTTIAECCALLEGRAEPRRVKRYGFAA